MRPMMECLALPRTTIPERHRLRLCVRMNCTRAMMATLLAAAAQFMR